MIWHCCCKELTIERCFFKQSILHSCNLQHPVVLTQTPNDQQCRYREQENQYVQQSQRLEPLSGRGQLAVSLHPRYWEQRSFGFRLIIVECLCWFPFQVQHGVWRSVDCWLTLHCKLLASLLVLSPWQHYRLPELSPRGTIPSQNVRPGTLRMSLSS